MHLSLVIDKDGGDIYLEVAFGDIEQPMLGNDKYLGAYAVLVGENIVDEFAPTEIGDLCVHSLHFANIHDFSQIYTLSFNTKQA